MNRRRQPYRKNVFTVAQVEQILGPILRGCVKGGLKFEVCGGIRRKRSRVGVVHMCVENLPRFDAGIKSLITAGRFTPDQVYTCTQKDVREAKRFEYIIESLRVLVFRASPHNWGSMLIYLTGNDLFNRMIRGEAKKQFMKLNQYGLFFNNEIIAGKSEEQVFYALSLDYVRPEDREATRTFRFARGSSNIWRSQ